MIYSNLQDFLDNIQTKDKMLAIDYGKKKIGIAHSCSFWSISMPKTIIKPKWGQNPVSLIIDYVKDKNFCAIAIGLPIMLNGEHSDQTDIVMSFARDLNDKIDLPIFMQ